MSFGVAHIDSRLVHFDVAIHLSGAVKDLQLVAIGIQMKKYLISTSLVLAGAAAWAGDPVTDAMQEAYAPYRVALFRTNSNAQVEAQQAIAQAQQAWTKLAQQYGEKPPAPYDRDPAFASSLLEVSKVYETAAPQVTANQLAVAHETLEKVRDIMAEIRRRNHVVVFSDHMNAYHTEMENLLISGPKVLVQPDGMQELIAMVGVLNYLAKRLSSEAPVSYEKNEEFAESVKAVEKAVRELQTAAFSQDVAAVKAAMAKVKAPYSRLFLKFG